MVYTYIYTKAIRIHLVRVHWYEFHFDRLMDSFPYVPSLIKLAIWAHHFRNFKCPLKPEIRSCLQSKFTRWLKLAWLLSNFFPCFFPVKLSPKWLQPFPLPASASSLALLAAFSAKALAFCSNLQCLTAKALAALFATESNEIPVSGKGWSIWRFLTLPFLAKLVTGRDTEPRASQWKDLQLYNGSRCAYIVCALCNMDMSTSPQQMGQWCVELQNPLQRSYITLSEFYSTCIGRRSVGCKGDV